MSVSRKDKRKGKRTVSKACILRTQMVGVTASYEGLVSEENEMIIRFKHGRQIFGGDKAYSLLMVKQWNWKLELKMVANDPNTADGEQRYMTEINVGVVNLTELKEFVDSLEAEWIDSLGDDFAVLHREWKLTIRKT